ncbi:MAG: 2-amino-4-hydroxy-6-hydroxymethyldihydropteridine diphosphokinase, partial [Paramuribaculum sp.]|nr:2-amino-4-hydroxy-6-hydroxymethyldihydropteridine diphosphokinase [Paramuribaculum sp.]
IDLIAIDSCVISDPPDLILPHPRMHLRPFVLIPFNQLQPDWVHPLLGLTPRQMLLKTLFEE